MNCKLRPDRHDGYAEALPDEPTFHLLARDPDAPELVRMWADRRERRIALGERPVSDEDMVRQARMIADGMEAWRNANDGVWRRLVPTGSRLVPRPWSEGKPDVLVTFSGNRIEVNGKIAGRQPMDADESTVWSDFHNALVSSRAARPDDRT